MSKVWNHHYEAPLRLAVRMTFASFVTYGIGEVLQLQQSLWAVLTSIIVMQASVGASLKAMFDRLTGSLGGAVAGVLISLVLHRSGVASPAAALALGLPPLTLLAAKKPSYRVAPITFIILIVSPDLQKLGAVNAAIQRMFEIGVGSVIALVVSLVVLPGRAHDALGQAVGHALSAMAALMRVLPKGLTSELDVMGVEAAHARIRSYITNAEAAAEEARREQASHLTEAPDPLPICRTLRRLRHDLAMLGRATAEPLPGAVSAAMTQPLVGVFAGIDEFLEASANAILARVAPPRLDGLDSAFADQAAAVSRIRQQGLSRALLDEELGRIFGLGFTLEQLHRDLQDLVDRGSELANKPAGKSKALQNLVRATERA